MKTKKNEPSYEIESGIPLPMDGRGSKGAIRSKLRIVMAKLSPGDSIALPRNKTARAWQVAKQIGIKIAIRHLDGETSRVWRTA